MTARAARLTGIALLLAAASAEAGAPDTFGFGARSGAMAGAQVAEARGGAAAFHNPAGVLRDQDVAAAIGWGGAITDLAIDGRSSPVTTPRGTSLGLSVPIRLGPLTAAFGLALYIPDQFLVRIQIIPAAEPRFILLDNNLHHLVVHPVLALRPFRWLAIGGGATILADAAGNGVKFDVGAVGGDTVGRGALDVSLPLRVAPLVGVLVEPLPRLRLGASYRGAIDLGLRFDILADVDVAGAVKGDVLISLRAVNLFTPDRVAVGAAWDIVPALTVSGEIDWLRWSQFKGGVADLRLRVDLGITPPLTRLEPPPDRFSDVVVPRLGVEYRRPLGERVELALRSGYAFERSSVPDQSGLTSFADNDRHVIALGAGIGLSRLLRFLDRPLRIDLAASWQELSPRATRKAAGFAPGTGFSSSGRLVHLACTVEARF